MEVIKIKDNKKCVVKGYVGEELFDPLKKLLKKKKMTQQDLIDKCVRDFIIDNITLLNEKQDNK